jgi:hypothetical protein
MRPNRILETFLWIYLPNEISLNSFPASLERLMKYILITIVVVLFTGGDMSLLIQANAQENRIQEKKPSRWIWSKAHAIPKETTSEESGYFSIIEGNNGKIYIGTSKYGDNAYLVEFEPKMETMKIVVDAEKEIGVDRKGFAAQAKFHTRNNVGKSGKIYMGTKQGYPKEGETRTDYPGGYPMVYHPSTGKTKVYGIPIPHQGIASITPDESRGVAYVSTCSDGRPRESSHFMILDLETGEYHDLMDCRHVYAFIVVDYLGRAYHPVLGGKIARYDPETERLEQLSQTIDGELPDHDTHLMDSKSHPINWDITPDRKMIYAVAMSHNALFAYDLTGEGDTLKGKTIGPLVKGALSTDCRAMCVGPDGTVWAGLMATLPGQPQLPRLVSYSFGDKEPIDHGPIAIGNPGYTDFKGPYQHGVHRPFGDHLVPRYVVMGICAAKAGTVYLTTLYPFTVHAVTIPKANGLIRKDGIRISE